MGHGVRSPGRDSLSLGSAVSLGTLQSASGPGAEPEPPVYCFRAAMRGRHNVEVGLVDGFDGTNGLPGWTAGGEVTPEPEAVRRAARYCEDYERLAEQARILAGRDR